MKPIHQIVLIGLLMLASSAHAETLRLVFAGDVMLADGPGRLIAAGGDPLAPFARVLADADYRIANLECAVSSGGIALPNKRYTFRADPRVTAVLKGRFDAVGVANNHSGDFGKDAFLDTIAHLDSAGIGHFGGGRNLAEAHAPLWIERKGLRIAVLGYNEFKPRSFEAGAAHIVIPFMHWGWEYDEAPSLRQRELAHRMIAAGADVVVGGHPHVVQNAELYRGRLIVYSLGNFVFDGFDAPEARQGWLLRLDLDKRGLAAWDTRLAQLDEEGTPSPVPGALTPCGKRVQRKIGECRNP